ncbi:PhoPQ-activated pathogenicity-related family protein [soil metagenome]
MKTWIARLAAGLLAALALHGASAAANPKNALDAYVAKADPSFAWKVDHTISGSGYHGVVLDMTSQTWLDASRVDKPVWKHWVTVIVPETVEHATGFLYIDGGQNTDKAPVAATERWAKMAVETHSVVVQLADVPNQPLRFAETPDKARVEDQIIAYQQAKVAKSGNLGELLRLPMVKSGTAAMTAVQQYLASDAGGRMKLDGFVVSGGSKRAWTAWLVAAVDPRVKAVIPIVINVLSVDATARHHWEAMGYFSPALGDYVENGLIPGLIGSPGMNRIQKLEDPLNYRDRPAMRMPKYVINAVGDQYFPPDNTKFGYHLLPAVKRLRMIPNSNHSTAGTDIMDSVTAFYGAVLSRRSIPNYSWKVRGDGAIVVRSAAEPTQVSLWSANNPKARDFRVDSIGKTFTSTPLTRGADGTWVGAPPKPAGGWTAYFVELVYASGGPYPFKFTTEVSVTPDTLPYKWKDAQPITAPPTPEQGGK